MGLAVTFVSGPRRSGKSAVIRAMIDRLWKHPPHYVRLVRIGSDKRPPKLPVKLPPDLGVASARWLRYDDDRIYHVLPEALTTIHRSDRYGSVVIESDADPAVRHAYPYDHRVFVMPIPSTVSEVFRTAEEAAAALQEVLKDTTTFASEMFGLWDAGAGGDGKDGNERVDLTATQWRGFLYSPLGEELATRIQLQPPYHGLVEADVVVVNTAVGSIPAEGNPCLERASSLLGHMRKLTSRGGEIFVCDLYNENDAVARRLLKALRPMCRGGK
ncbi:MAG: hypothetical protein C4547_12240 [Phycisphaerales bacterium]|nr:MAG: hypothetical protein C4547_12240 [Phycisphaerales bacterium]